MKLEFVPEPKPPTKFPQGYWYAEMDDGSADAVGATPLDATCALVIKIEELWNRVL